MRSESKEDLVETESENILEEKEVDIIINEDVKIIKNGVCNEPHLNGLKNEIDGIHQEEKDVDDFLTDIGQFGRTQIILVTVFCIIIIPSTYQTLIMSFIGNAPGWKCAAGNTECNRTGEFKIDHNFYKSRCHMNRSSWEFIKSKEYSIVTEWDLVCGKETHSFLANSALFIGWAIGAIILGYISDRYGRKIVLFPAWTGLLLLSFASSFVNSFWLFFTLRLLIGVCQGGIGLTLFVLASELVGPAYRSFSGTTIWFAFTFALCLMALQAWLLPKWRTLEIITSIPYLILLGSYKFIPESVRWLRLNEKVKEAEKVLQKVAKINKKPWPNARLSRPPTSSGGKATFKYLFFPRVMCISTLIQCFAWYLF